MAKTSKTPSRPAPAKPAKTRAKGTPPKAAPSAFLARAMQAKAVASEQRKAELAAAIALIERRLAQIKEAFFDIGLTLRDIVDKRLYEHGEPPATSFDAFLDGRRWMGRSTAWQLVELSRVYSREQALGLGQHKGQELLRYAGDVLGDRALARRLADEGKLEGKPLEVLSGEEVARMRDRMLAKKKTAAKPSAAAKAERALLSRVRRALSELGLPVGELEVSGAGEERVLLARFPMARIERFLDERD